MLIFIWKLNLKHAGLVMDLAMSVLALCGLWTPLILGAGCFPFLCLSKHSAPEGFDDPAGTADCSSQQPGCLPSSSQTASLPPFFLIYFKLKKIKGKKDTPPLQIINLFASVDFNSRWATSPDTFSPAGFWALVSDDIVWVLQPLASEGELQREYPRKLCIALCISSLLGNVQIVNRRDSSAVDMGLNELIT